MVQTQLLLTCLILLFSGTFRPIGYVKVEPFSKPFTEKVEKPINLVFMEDVKDEFHVVGDGQNNMKVNDFRRSMSYAMTKVLEKNFNGVNVVDSKPDNGLSLVIYRVRPFWSATNQQVIDDINPTINVAFQFETRLYNGNVKLKDFDSTIYSNFQLSSPLQSQTVFEDGLIKTCETINKEIFTDEVINAIKGK